MTTSSLPVPVRARPLPVPVAVTPWICPATVTNPQVVLQDLDFKLLLHSVILPMIICYFIYSVALTPYVQAAAPEMPKAVAPKLIKFKSFDRLEVPAMYYYPDAGRSKAPVIIGIHGGSELQATVQYKT